MRDFYRFGNSTFCVCDHAAFTVDDDGEMLVIAKGRGLSSAYVSAGVADADGRFYAVGYEDGSLDVWKQGRVYSIDDVTLGNTLCDRRINSITYSASLIVVSGGFGVSLVDLDRVEVMASCRLPEAVERSVVRDGVVYCVGTGNVYRADVTNVNIQDPACWSVCNPKDVNIIASEAKEKYNGPVPACVPSDRVNALASADGVLGMAGDFYADVSKGASFALRADEGMEFSSIFYNPYNWRHVFLGGDDGCLYEYVSHSPKARYDYGIRGGKIVGMDCTRDGDLFLLQDGMRPRVMVFDHDGVWHDVPWLDAVAALDGARQIVRVSDDVMWLNLGDRLVAVALNGTPLDFGDDVVRVFVPRAAEGRNVGSEITCMAVDAVGRVWLGGDNGVAYIADAAAVFGESAVFTRPIITETDDRDGDYSQYLLNGERIADVAFDGAGRVWVASAYHGVYVVDAAEGRELMRFNERNSPLPSDTIAHMEVVGKTGEVFFATRNGMASYMTNTQVPMSTLDEVVLYPNPVRPGYNGDVYVSGLEDGCDVRITDVAGRLVFSAKSQGGKLAWNGENLNGHRCATGVYLVFVCNVDTGDTVVKKLLFVR